jgi:NitT/TauT family transport system substrate-binding protein
MAAMQVSPRCVIVHENSGIRALKDLGQVGTLAVSSTATWSLFLQKTVDLKGVQLVPYTGNVSQFLLNDDFAQQGYSISEPFVARLQMAQPRVLMVSDLGFNPYTSVLITTPEVIRTRPELVAEMVKASVSGWLKYLDNPSQTNQAISDRNEDMGLPILAFGARELKTLCVTPETPRHAGRRCSDNWSTSRRLKTARWMSRKCSPTGSWMNRDCPGQANPSCHL